MNLEKIGNFIKTLREQNNITQDELANKIFVDRTLISKWEKGTTSITSEHLKSLSMYFNVSTDEILSGEFITKENKDKINNIKYEIYDNNLIIKKRLKILFTIIIIIIFLFLLYFFFTFYNSVSIYYVNTEPDKIKLNEGLFIKTKDYLIFKLDVNNNENIKELNLYYTVDDNNKTIVKSNNKSIYIIDYIDNQEYFEFNKISDILKNTYLKIEYNNGEIINTKINYMKLYSNKSIFHRTKRQYLDDTTKNNNETSKIGNKLEYVYDKYSEFTTNIKIDNIKFNVQIFDNNLIANYEFKNSNYVIEYAKLEYEYLSKSKDDVELYSDSISKDKCKNNDSDECNKDLEIINKILDYLIKNEK